MTSRGLFHNSDLNIKLLPSVWNTMSCAHAEMVPIVGFLPSATIGDIETA